MTVGILGGFLYNIHALYCKIRSMKLVYDLWDNIWQQFLFICKLWEAIYTIKPRFSYRGEAALHRPDQFLELHEDGSDLTDWLSDQARRIILVLNCCLPRGPLNYNGQSESRIVELIWIKNYALILNINVVTRVNVTTVVENFRIRALLCVNIFKRSTSSYKRTTF